MWVYREKDSIKKYFKNFSNTFALDHIINFFLDHPVCILIKFSFLKGVKIQDNTENEKLTLTKKKIKKENISFCFADEAIAITKEPKEFKINKSIGLQDLIFGSDISVKLYYFCPRGPLYKIWGAHVSG